MCILIGIVSLAAHRGVLLVFRVLFCGMHREILATIDKGYFIIYIYRDSLLRDTRIETLALQNSGGGVLALIYTQCVGGHPGVYIFLHLYRLVCVVALALAHGLLSFSFCIICSFSTVCVMSYRTSLSG